MVVESHGPHKDHADQRIEDDAEIQSVAKTAPADARQLGLKLREGTRICS
jgi:hypothetical protein